MMTNKTNNTHHQLEIVFDDRADRNYIFLFIFLLRLRVCVVNENLY